MSNAVAESPVSTAENVSLSVFNIRRASHILSTLSPTNQLKVVLNHIIMKGSISQLEADELYRVKRLTSRITELKGLGVAVVAEMRRDNTGKRYARYFIAS
jgi:hypothetical protein